MFTGIVESQAVLCGKKKSRNHFHLTFEVLGRNLRPFRRGESVAVDGVCLTVADFRGKKFKTDLIRETLRATSLGGLELGERVNLERSLRLGDSLGGHWVSGHVDGLGHIQKIESQNGGFRLQIKAASPVIKFLVSKGSIAVDGISFTLQEIRKQFFTVGVTPHTYRATTLRRKRVGDPVNLEIDFFAKMVRHFIPGRRR